MKVRTLILAIVFAGCGTVPWTSQLPQTDVQVVSNGQWLVETGNWYTRVAKLTYDSANGDFAYFPDSQSPPPDDQNPFGVGDSRWAAASWPADRRRPR